MSLGKDSFRGVWRTMFTPWTHMVEHIAGKKMIEGLVNRLRADLSPEPYAQLYEAVRSRKWQRVREMQKLINYA